MPKNSNANLPVTPEMLARLITFVKKYVSKRQWEAADLLGVSQSTISNVFLGNRAPSSTIWNTLVTKYNLNQDWLVNGVGNPVRKKEEEKTTLVKDLSALNVKITKLEKLMERYEANQNHLFKVIERLEKRVHEAKD